MAKTTQEKIISMPLYLALSKRKGAKKYYLNLNHYRNWHFHTSNNLKKAYKERVSPELENLSFKQIELTLTLHMPNKRKVDRSNYLTVHEKFFCDALVEHGCIEDDNNNFLYATHYYSGEIDKENPRVDIKIQDVS
jgi:Holliday junction resolvase RusA-like endonuclease